LDVDKDANQTGDYCVAAMYKFADLGGCAATMPKLRDSILQTLTDNLIGGTIIIAEEGINGTIAGRSNSIEAFLVFLRQNSVFEGRFEDIEAKFSKCSDQPFGRTRVKIKPEIVTMRVEGVSPTRAVGHYVNPEDWNDLIDDPSVLVIDTRNDFEFQVGTFVSGSGETSANPETVAFCDFPAYVAKELEQNKDTKIAMFCTGGIRCEKATSYMLEQGFSDVHHLKGGILKYLEVVPETESRWQGECFVFDERVAVDHNLKPGQYLLCHACRMPLTMEESKHVHYEQGVSCHRCFGTHTTEHLASLRERQKQVELSASRGERHIGIKFG
jgi:UPF0176 protein